MKWFIITNKNFFVAFVDLKKAYDKINRQALIFKLKKRGFSGKYLMSIKAMVENVVQIPKIYGKLLPPTVSVTSTGLKQGDNLSPILFVIFFYDVDDIFDSERDPVILSSDTSDISLNHLFYADDMALLSLSQEGLQHSLHKLEVYCKKWHLEVSIRKTKIIVFNNTGRLLKGFMFKYDNKHLELVREFKYLGTTLTISGGLSNAKEKLRSQANKAYFPMLRALQKINYDVPQGVYLKKN